MIHLDDKKEGCHCQRSRYPYQGKRSGGEVKGLEERELPSWYQQKPLLPVHICATAMDAQGCLLSYVTIR